ncbi:MAG: hypothetical protein D6816_10695 [Bacteroidetes bacterium]|nr:MAG: hypothetical protein D6816_10695 [Bacteroidota bacterium]
MTTEVSSQIPKPTGEWNAEWFGKTLEILSHCKTLSTEDRCAILAALAEVGSELININGTKSGESSHIVIGVPMDMMHLIVSALVRLVAETLMFTGEVPDRDTAMLNIKTVFAALKIPHDEGN